MPLIMICSCAEIEKEILSISLLPRNARGFISKEPVAFLTVNKVETTGALSRLALTVTSNGATVGVVNQNCTNSALKGAS